MNELHSGGAYPPQRVGTIPGFDDRFLSKSPRELVDDGLWTVCGDGREIVANREQDADGVGPHNYPRGSGYCQSFAVKATQRRNAPPKHQSRFDQMGSSNRGRTTVRVADSAARLYAVPTRLADGDEIGRAHV